ncbi:hypothetical protein HL658_31850 [Azospirillum sp. RWY-5-1]|uniref:Histidine kinase/HSP90-like ATPase domain-containing protein n=1 Tax=Azospirillum oleiclasticum TaxID=2735135 RepID=A0ABX2TFV1_9PROT|nr:ATP-binding protein [Azospirillum oleiclasticum]NYZ17162.1 hypothetical protein [Azospirillum oleiclasticum]NYZ23128.1 hypothetical protein [Azospirillum oleiclasticum]
MPIDRAIAWGARPPEMVPPSAPLGTVHLDPELQGTGNGALPWPWPPRRALLALALAARTVAGGLLPDQLTRWGRAHGLWAEDAAAAVETALAEALANAVVHGCLGLPGMAAFQPDPQAYFDAVDAGLADDRLARRPVFLVVRRCVRLTVVHVADRGAGFRPAVSGLAVSGLALTGSGVAGAVSGRGLALIRGLTRRMRLSDGGRRISLSFLRVEREP